MSRTSARSFHLPPDDTIFAFPSLLVTLVSETPIQTFDRSNGLAKVRGFLQHSKIGTKPDTSLPHSQTPNVEFLTRYY